MENTPTNKEGIILPPADLKKYSDLNEIFVDYEKLANEASSIIICNYSALNMAIEMGFSQVNKGKLKNILEDGDGQSDLKQLEEMCGHLMRKDNQSDSQKRLEIIKMFVDLMVYDLQGLKDGVSELDFEDCLSEFLTLNYSIEDEYESIHEVAVIMMKIR